MLRVLLSTLVALITTAIIPAFADIVDVSVNGTVSGSGSVTVVCGLATPGCMPAPPPFFGLMTIPFSFTASNTNLGLFSDSGGGTSFPSASSFASQDSSATADSLGITLVGGHSAFALLFSATESDSISISFDLTEASLVKLLGGGFGIGPDVGQLEDSHGNVILTVPNSPSPVFADLEPGTYVLTASANGGGSGSALVGVNVTDFHSGIEANFTALPTPEPVAALLVALLTALIGGCAFMRTARK